MGKRLSQLGQAEQVKKEDYLLVDGQDYLESKKIPFKDINLSNFNTDGFYNQNTVDSLLEQKQNSLVSGKTIKTINGLNLLGEGNITIVTDADQTYNPNSKNAQSGKAVSEAVSIEQNRADNTFANVLKGSKSGSVIPIDDISPVSHEMGVRVRGKNLFDISKITNTSNITNNGDGTLTVKPNAYGVTTSKKLSVVCPDLKVGDVATLKFTTESSAKSIYLSVAKAYWNSSASLAVTQEHLDSVISIYGYRSTDTDYGNPCTISNIQIELGTTATAYTPYVPDLTAIKVSRYWKNLFDINNPIYATNSSANFGKLPKIEDGVIYFNTWYGNAGGLGFVVPMPSNTTFTISFDVAQGEFMTDIYYCESIGTDGVMINCRQFAPQYKNISSVTYTQPNGMNYILFYLSCIGGYFKCGVKNVQIELGSTATEYEPYITPTEYIPSTDGTVEGVASLYPSTTLMTNTDGVIIDCEYNKDINKFSGIDVDVPTKTSELINDSNFATQDYVDEEIANFDFIKIVTELPATGLVNRTYFVPKQNPNTNDLYDEYMWVDGKWELITTKQIEVDLTEYVKHTDINQSYNPLSENAQSGTAIHGVLGDLPTESPGGKFINLIDHINKLIAMVRNEYESTKQDKLTAGDNITIENNVISALSHPTDSIMWKEPKNFGKKVNGIVGDNIKLYRDVYDETLVFMGSGEMYDATNYNDPYLFECGLGAGSSTARNIVIQEGITSIGYYVFNRVYTLNNSNVKKYETEKYTDIGSTIRTLVIPKSVSRFVGRSFQYCHISNKIIINCDSDLIIEQQAFESAWLDTIEIPNATSIGGYGNNTFNTDVLKNLSIGKDTCQFQTSVSFSTCSKLTADSLINIANHLKLISSGETAQTLTLHATPKTLCTNTKGEIADGVFVKNASGTVTLTDFITNTKGWTIA